MDRLPVIAKNILKNTNLSLVTGHTLSLALDFAPIPQVQLRQNLL